MRSASTHAAGVARPTPHTCAPPEVGQAPQLPRSQRHFPHIYPIRHPEARLRGPWGHLPTSSDRVVAKPRCW